MLNKAAGMDNEQALASAAHVPDWRQFATRPDLLRMEVRLVLYRVGLRLVTAGIDQLWR